MKAAICIKYGGPENIVVREIEKPTPKDNQILVKIKASTLNSGDVRVRSLKANWFLKIMMRLIIGIKRPRKAILGTVYSGIVEQIGNKVNSFKIGDEVFGITGFNFSCHAEYIVVNEKSNIIKKPQNASFSEAAAIAFGGQTAIYFLEKAAIKNLENPKIMIYGASGSVGSSAVQIAQFYNAEITAVASTTSQEFIKKLNPDFCLDYTQNEFKKSTKKYDIIFDAVGKIKKNDIQNNLIKGGKFVSVASGDYASENKQQLILLKELFEMGKLNAYIDQVYPLEKIAQAHQYVDSERKKGNVVIEMSEFIN